MLRHRSPIALSLLLALGACSSAARDSAARSSTTVATPAVGATDPATTLGAVDTTPPAVPDPCSIVSQTQASAIVGVSLLAPTSVGGADDRMCQYTSDPAGPTAQVEVFTGPGAKKMLDIDKDTLQHTFTTLTGVGDEAYLEDSNLFVRKGTTWAAVNVVVLDADPATVQAALTSIAPVIAAELP